MRLVERIYDYLKTHALARNLSLALVTVLLLLSVLRISYKENISDFLPLSEEKQEAFAVFQNLSGADRLVIMFDNPGDNDRTVEAVDYFCVKLEENDTAQWTKDLISQFDINQFASTMEFVYKNIPYFLTDEDYARMDSLLSLPGYTSDKMQEDYESMLLPSGPFAASKVALDPYDLFSPVMSRLQKFNRNSPLETYEGYMFTPDMKKAMVTLKSPFGNSETEMNGRLLKLLETTIQETETEFPDVRVHIIGGPQIAVGNASQIKTDSIIAIVLSAVLIMALLLYSFRSGRNIMLVLVSIVWGGLFALGAIVLFKNEISIIVLGISSIIIGIAVNYPLHLIIHTRHNPNIKNSIREIVVPLVVGNVTTVGAFLTLVPLKSVALRDLGLFASFLLIGTILFVVIYLPHYIKVGNIPGSMKLLNRLSSVNIETNKPLIIIVTVFTLVFGWFCFDTEFDTNMSNINYMTAEQKEDMKCLQSAFAESGSSDVQEVYVVSAAKSNDEALTMNEGKRNAIEQIQRKGLIEGFSGVSSFLVSIKEQEKRIRKWNDFVDRHGAEIATHLSKEAVAYGFSEDAFEIFKEVMSTEYKPQELSYFEPLTSSVFVSNVYCNEKDGRYAIVEKMSVKKENVADVENAIDGSFDISNLNSSLAQSISDDFNYIGIACSCIVFLFLCFSFGSVELAVVSFIPMAVSWIWILGIMSILGVKFNIVNIILATFIFGQGDDYTIFITEGCCYEYAYKKKMLPYFKNSIMLSALIMFAGVCTLIFAKHPALHSLAELTIIGMFSVVLMAYLLPPLIFKMLVEKNGKERRAPLSLSMLFRRKSGDSLSLCLRQVKDRYMYRGVEIMASVRRSLGRKSVCRDIANMQVAKERVVVKDNGYGELAMLFAYAHSDVSVVVYMADEEKREIARNAYSDFVPNAGFVDAVADEEILELDARK